MTPADFREETDRFEKLVERAERFAGVKSTGGTAHVQVHAGGIGVTICACACAAMMAMNIFLCALYLDQQAHIRDLDAYLSAIYMQAPYLKPKEK